MNYREEIGSELQTLRVQKGLTVRELGDMCGMQHSSIVKIENGRYNVSVDILGKVADALGCKLTFEPKSVKIYSLDHVGKTVGEFRRGLEGSGFKYVEIGNTLISCDANEEHSYDDWMVEEIFIDGMRNGIIEVTARKRYGR